MSRYHLSPEEVVQIVACMKSRNCIKGWVAIVTKSSVIVVECEYCPDLWKNIWRALSRYYNKDKVQLPDKISELQKLFNGLTETYTVNSTRLLGEFPRISGHYSELPTTDKYTPYYVPTSEIRIDGNLCLENSFEEIALKISDYIREGFNFLRVEASEIIAFVATDVDRVVKPGLPPHIPIAYGLRGSSMPLDVMRNMINDLRNDLVKRKCQVLCEVYDGQFHSLMVKSETGYPLTRLQLIQQHFKEKMQDYTREELIKLLLTYSTIDEDNKSELANYKIQTASIKKMSSITVEMKRIVMEDDIIRQIFIQTNAVGNFSMKDIETNHRESVWNKYLRQRNNTAADIQNVNNKLSRTDICNLIKGSKVHRRIVHQNIDNNSSLEGSSDEEDVDPSYVPINSESDFTDSDNESDVEEEFIEHNISVASTSSTGSSCIKQILKGLQKIRNKHDWKNENIDSLLKKYMSSKASLNKLFLYEMDLINDQVHDSLGKYLFDKKDKKNVRVKKIYSQLKQMPQLLQYETSSDEGEHMFQPKSLFKTYHNFISSGKYPKEFLAAAVCKLNHMEIVSQWESNSPVPIVLDIPLANTEHVIFNYPEKNVSRNQVEMRTFDYTHILNNLRFHVSNDAINGIKQKAFIEVSEINHDVLPRSIVEDKLDRQNCSISRRFFSKEVQKILTQLGYHDEAEFTGLTRNWFRACDERGLDVQRRMTYLQSMYDYLLGKVNLSEYPPPSTHVFGLPVKTFEAILHCISTRFLLFVLSSKNAYNTRAVSTLAVESFFSDLTRYEFSGLGAPKAVDIPKLISHIVYINTIKHDPTRGFEFTTSTRDNYPTYFMEITDDQTNYYDFKNHAFDKSKTRRKRSLHTLATLSKPKGITRGGKGIRQFLAIDETKLSMEQRFGKNIKLDDCQI